MLIAWFYSVELELKFCACLSYATICDGEKIQQLSQKEKDFNQPTISQEPVSIIITITSIINFIVKGTGRG